MSRTFSCRSCGKTAPSSGNYDATPHGWYSKYYCCEGHKMDFENKKSSKSAEKSEVDQVKSAENAELEARKAEAKSQENSSKWQTYAKLGTAAFTAASSTGKEVKETTDYLAKMVFSSDPEELGNQLSEISSMWGGAEKYMIKDNTDAVKKAALEKFEFGFMKLNQVGMPHQVEFFAKKLKEMKPKKFFGLF